MANKM